MGRPRTGKTFTCKQCSEQFYRNNHDINRGRVHYCSLKCSGAAHGGQNNYFYKHGYTKGGKVSKEWMSWNAMIDRCYTKSSSTYKKYGAKGIIVCDRWRDKEQGFIYFLDDMGLKPTSKHTLDRIDGTKNYTPENCRWASYLEQANNQKSNVKVTYKGETYNISQLMRKLGMYTKSGVYYSRLKRGWSVERTFNTPVKTK